MFYIRHFTLEDMARAIIASNNQHRFPKLVARARGLSIGIVITPDKISYTTARCDVVDVFNRKLGHNLVSQREASAIEVPQAIYDKLVRPSCKVDFTTLNPHLIMDTVASYLIARI